MKKNFLIFGRLVVASIFIWLSISFFDINQLIEDSKKLFENPTIFISMVLLYFLAFLLRAKAWQVYLSGTASFKNCLDGLLYSLFLNHILPVKAGDMVRIGFITFKSSVNWKSAVQSVIVMRIIDLFVLGSISVIGAIIIGLNLSFWFILIGLMGIIPLLFIIKKFKPVILSELHKIIYFYKSFKGFYVFTLILLSWICEAFVVFFVLYQIQTPVSFLQAIWVNSFTIAGQVFHFTPGGLGTYESFMSFSLSTLGVNIGDAYVISLISHGFKFLFSYGIGVYLFITAPVSWWKLMSWKNLKGEEIQ